MRHRLSSLHSMLVEAKRELELSKRLHSKVHLLQAGEKAWNAAYQLVVINQANLGKPLPTSHSEVVGAMGRLRFKKKTIAKFRRISKRLHQNFYADNLDFATVKKYVDFLDERIKYHLRRFSG